MAAVVEDTSVNRVTISPTDQEVESIEKKLRCLECPFTWNITNNRDTSQQIIDKTIIKIQEIEDESAFQWHVFVLNLVLCYEYFRIGSYSKSELHQKECEKMLNSGDWEGVYETFFQATKAALFHIVWSCKCHLLLIQNSLNEAENVFTIICKYDDMSNACKAAIWGTRGAVAMEYAFEGKQVAVKCAEKALELDEQAEWHFLLGKALGRLRRINNYTDMPDDRELEELEKAVQLEKNPSYIIFLAQAYREAASKRHSINRVKKTLDFMNERSAELYREALSLRRDCSHFNIRCAQGFLALPPPFRDVKLAKDLCDRSLALAPTNGMVNHIAGGLYENFEGNMEKAMELYEVAGENGAYGGYMDLLKLKYYRDPEWYNPIPEFEYVLTQYTEKPRKMETLAQMGSFYFFIKSDLVTAYKYWKQIIDGNPSSDKLQNHVCNFVNMKKSVNIYELILNEAQLMLKTGGFKSDEDIRTFQQVVTDISHRFPEMQSGFPKSKRKMILEEATNIQDHSSFVDEEEEGSVGEED